MLLQVVVSWIMAVDGAFISAVSLWLAVNYLRDSPELVEEGKRSLQKAAYNVAFTLAITLLVTVSIWDFSNPSQQFPFTIRLAFMIPILILANFALFGRVWKRK